MIPAEFSQNNTLMSISYWRSLEDLEAWARRPVHLKGLKFLDFQVNKSNKPHDLGVMVSSHPDLRSQHRHALTVTVAA